MNQFIGAKDRWKFENWAQTRIGLKLTLWHAKWFLNNQK